MSNITIKRVGELVRALFEILWNKPDGLTAKELFSVFPKKIHLTEDELRYSSLSNLPRYERIVRLATIPLVHACWLTKTEKGRWFITDDGFQACKRFSNAQDFYKEAMRLFEESRQPIPEKRIVNEIARDGGFTQIEKIFWQLDPSKSQTMLTNFLQSKDYYPTWIVPPESIIVIELAQEAAWMQIEKHFQLLHHAKLQSMLAELLRAMDYYPSWVAPPEKNRGIVDLIAYVDPIGAKGRRIIAQIKHKGQAVTLEGVKSFSSTLGCNDYGVIFSTGGFTNEVLRMMASGTFDKITALDTSAFFDLWKQYYSQLSQEARRLLPLKSVYFLSRDS